MTQHHSYSWLAF
jgi:hypothetical protein